MLRPSDCLAAFDGDYATGTVTLGGHDPLQACLDAVAGTFVHDRWLIRRLPARVGIRERAFSRPQFRETDGAGYMLSSVDRAIDTSPASGRFGDGMAATLKAEARGRVEAGTIFGHIAYVSLVARVRRRGD